jgi:hypothetical protein
MNNGLPCGSFRSEGERVLAESKGTPVGHHAAQALVFADPFAADFAFSA